MRFLYKMCVSFHSFKGHSMLTISYLVPVNLQLVETIINIHSLEISAEIVNPIMLLVVMVISIILTLNRVFLFKK